MGQNRIEKKDELFAGKLVQILVITAAIITAGGGIVFLIVSGQNSFDYSTFSGIPEYLRTIEGITKNALSGNSTAIIQSGVLILIAIPVIRVVVFLVSFIKERDWIYVVITAFVIGVLMFSLLGGKG